MTETSRVIDSIGMTEEEVQPYLDYLDNLRESGVTNMFGAHRFVTGQFNVTDSQARAITAYWMGTFLLKGESE